MRQTTRHSKPLQAVDRYRAAVNEYAAALSDAVEPLVRLRYNKNPPRRAALGRFLHRTVGIATAGRATYTFTTGHGRIDVTYNYAEDDIVRMQLVTDEANYPVRPDGVALYAQVRDFYEALSRTPALVEALWLREKGRVPDVVRSLEPTFEQVTTARNKIRTDATARTLIEAQQRQNDELLTFLLDEDRPISMQTGTEAQAYYTMDEPFVQYADDTLALVRPDRRPSRRGQRGFLVGVDDAGCFVHPIDVTLLPRRRRVTRQMIREAAGYDIEYEQGLRLDDDTRVRVQGDLRLARERAISSVDKAANVIGSLLSGSLTSAIRAARNTPDRSIANEVTEYRKDGWTDTEQLNLPIDNHLVIVPRGWVRGGQANEPIRVCIPIETQITVIHDEHATRKVRVTPGVYELSLLPRGLRPPARRPRWT